MRRRLFFLSAVLWISAPTLAVPPEPSAPTSFAECQQLAHAYSSEVLAYSQRHTDCSHQRDRRSNVFYNYGRGMCAAIVTQRHCRQIVEQCDRVRDEGEAAVQRCNDSVTAYNKAKRDRDKYITFHDRAEKLTIDQGFSSSGVKKIQGKIADQIRRSNLETIDSINSASEDIEKVSHGSEFQRSSSPTSGASVLRERNALRGKLGDSCTRSTDCEGALMCYGQRCTSP